MTPSNFLKICRRAYTKYQAVEFLGGHCYRCHKTFIPPAFDIVGVHRFSDRERFDSLLISELKRAKLLCGNCTAIQMGQKRNKRHFNKAKAILMLGGSCAVCGTKDYRTIQFHHVDSKTERLANLYEKWYDMKTELKKTVPLCVICHRLHHYRFEVLNRLDEFERLAEGREEPHILYTKELWNSVVEMDELGKNFELKEWQTR